jgi:hypothetical protein
MGYSFEIDAVKILPNEELKFGSLTISSRSRRRTLVFHTKAGGIRALERIRVPIDCAGLSFDSADSSAWAPEPVSPRNPVLSTLPSWVTTAPTFGWGPIVLSHALPRDRHRQLHQFAVGIFSISVYHEKSILACL